MYIGICISVYILYLCVCVHSIPALLAASGRITVFVPAAVLTHCIIYYITQALRQLPAMPPKSAGKSKGPDGMALVMAAVRHPQCSRQHLRVTHACVHAYIPADVHAFSRR